MEDDSNRARQIKIHYAAARDATLEAHEWSFAIVRFVPSATADSPAWGATYAFTVPAEVIRVLAVYANDDGSASTFKREQIEWHMEENKILCDEPVIYVRAIQRVEEEGRFSPLFVLALATQLAAMTALSLTAAADIQANMLSLYAARIHEAKTRDGLQGRSKRIRNRTLQKAR